MSRPYLIEIVTPLATVAIVLVMAGTARAADPYGRPGSTWSGPYAGVHIGGGVGEAGSVNTSGGVIGAQAGYNVQVDQFVVGPEVDISASSVSHDSFVSKYRQKWNGSLRGRAGVAFDQALVYGTAGLAVAGHELKTGGASVEKTHTGIAVGAGADFKLSQNVILRGEALHYNYGKETYTSTLGPVRIDSYTNVIRGGINLKF